jgi:hypothetical protein
MLKITAIRSLTVSVNRNNKGLLVNSTRVKGIIRGSVNKGFQG